MVRKSLGLWLWQWQLSELKSDIFHGLHGQQTFGLWLWQWCNKYSSVCVHTAVLECTRVYTQLYTVYRCRSTCSLLEYMYGRIHVLLDVAACWTSRPHRIDRFRRNYGTKLYCVLGCEKTTDIWKLTFDKWYTFDFSALFRNIKRALFICPNMEGIKIKKWIMHLKKFRTSEGSVLLRVPV